MIVNHSISNLKIISTSAHKSTLAFSAEVYPEDPSLDSVAKLDKQYKDAKRNADVMVFDKLFVRHWDTWTGEKKQLVFCLDLQKGGNSSSETTKELDELDIQSLPSTDDGESLDLPSTSANAQWTTVGIPLTPMAGLKNVECPVRPFGGSEEFDLSADHMLAFITKDPNLPEAWHTRMHVYIVPLQPKNASEKVPRCLSSMGGARTSPVFSPSAKGKHHAGHRRLAWLEMRKDGYEADRNRVIVYDLDSDKRYAISEDWDRSPSSVQWGEDDNTLFAVAEVGVLQLLCLIAPSDTAITGRRP
jgi:dipeptidyl aminopeptidase/acylaminoacyl peptidase